MRNRTDIRLVRVSAASLLVMMIWHGAPDLRDAVRYRSATLVRIDIGIAVLLLITAAALNHALQQTPRSQSPAQGRSRVSRNVAIAVLMMACSAALATGLQIGLFLYTVAGASLFCIGLAAAAAATIRLAGDRALSTAGFAAVLYFAAAGAAFQVGAAPAVIELLHRS